MSFKVTWKTHIICFILALLISLSMTEVIYTTFINILITIKIFNFTRDFVINCSLMVLILMVPITIIHEGIHGLCYKLFGGKVIFGFKGIYAYCQEVSGKELHRTKFLIVLLAPVTVISLLSLLLPVYLGGIIFILNLVCSTGDLYMAFYLIRSNSRSYILDRKYGFDVITLNWI